MRWTGTTVKAVMALRHPGIGRGAEWMRASREFWGRNLFAVIFWPVVVSTTAVRRGASSLRRNR